MRGAIFRDVGIALSTSYAMNARPALDVCATRQALITVALAQPVQNRMQADYVQRLIGTPSPDVNFDGLTKLEARAQCALVRKVAEEQLEASLAGAVLARFGETQQEQEAGINRLATHFTARGECGRAGLSGDPARIEAVRMLIVRRYCPQAFRKGFSFRAIAAQTCVPKSTLARIANLIEREADALEAQAIAQIEAILVPRGVCDRSVSKVDIDRSVLLTILKHR